VVIEDDSGIPYHTSLNRRCGVHLFGATTSRSTCSRPAAGRPESRLDAHTGVEPLDFSIAKVAQTIQPATRRS